MCAIRTTKAYVVKFSEVSAENAYKVGEGDRTLTTWRRVHETFFKSDRQCSPDMDVLCEEFEVVVGNRSRIYNTQKRLRICQRFFVFTAFHCKAERKPQVTLV
ncbi:MAG: ASCH domain-containing protein [Streptococcaceae bacterium]|nr:ASCH domain-containing protein [Streptococcaceae bacterium]